MLNFINFPQNGENSLMSPTPSTPPSTLPKEIWALWIEMAQIPADQGEEARQYYDQKVFPALVGFHAKEASQRRKASLLFINVGTQPYSPALGLVANPHAKAFLLYTDETKRFLEQVKALAGDYRGDCEEAYIGDGTQSAEAMNVLHDLYLREGEPHPHDVVVDVTSGRKATAAAMGAISAARDFRQTYLEGDPHIPHRLFVFTTRFVQLPSALLLCGQDLRWRIEALVQAGNPRAALQVSKHLMKESFAGQKDHKKHAALSLWNGIADADIVEVNRWIKKIMKLDPPKDLKNAIEGLGGQVESSKTVEMLCAALLENTLTKKQEELAAKCVLTLSPKLGGSPQEVAGKVLGRRGQEQTARSTRALMKALWKELSHGY